MEINIFAVWKITNLLWNVGSAGKRDEESEEESQLYDDVLVPILKEMTAISRNASGITLIMNYNKKFVWY